MARQKRQFARQGAASDLPDRASVKAYAGPPGEPIWNGERLVMQDGTPGGAPLARCGRRQIADQNASLSASDAYVGVTTITARRVISLPAAAAFEAGQPLYIADETGLLSVDSGLTITVSALGSDTIGTSDGRFSSVDLASPYQKLTFHSNGTNLWTFA